MLDLDIFVMQVAFDVDNYCNGMLLDDVSRDFIKLTCFSVILLIYAHNILHFLLGCSLQYSKEGRRSYFASFLDVDDRVVLSFEFVVGIFLLIVMCHNSV